MAAAAAMATGVASTLRPPVAAFLRLNKTRSSPLRWPRFRTLVSAASDSTAGGSVGGEAKQRQLVLYTKQGCCLCEGLKEKLDTAFLLGGPNSLSSVQLQVRDIAGNPEWERRYQYEVPVLARVLSDGSEQVLPRLSPRLGVELIQKKIASALAD